MLDKIKNKRIIIAIVLLILIFSFYFTYYLYQIYSHSDTNLKNKEYTAAIVLTGDQYRIQKGISLLKENIVSKLLISGVNKKINKKSMIAEFPLSLIHI